MASIFEDLWDGITDYFGGGKESSRKYEERTKAAAEEYKRAVEEAASRRDASYKQLKEEYANAMKEASDAYGISVKELQDYLKGETEAAEATRKSDKELTAEGREAASATANNKAGLAKRNAKAAAMQTSGSKLMSAIQAAQGAVDASTAGYDEASSEHASRAAALNQASIANRINQANQLAGTMGEAAKNKYSTATNAATDKLSVDLKNAENAYNASEAAAKSKFDAANTAAENAANTSAENRKRKDNLMATALNSFLR